MKILVVEDEQKIANSLQRGLQAEGYVVDVAEDGDMAETLTGATTYDLVLLDWMIPGKHDGPGLIKLWQEQKKFMPILMLTAKGTIGDHVWSDDSRVQHNTVETFVANLRKKVDKPGGENVVKTVRGFGYTAV
jgi:DNA-binding response OmpR family regulator